MPTIVYLDTNFWIDLYRASRNEGGLDNRTYQDILDRVRSGDLCLPLSHVHCTELLKLSDRGKRRDLWRFATELSQCIGLVNRQILLPGLIEEAVYKVFGVPLGREPVNPFTRSGLFGIGREKGFKLTEAVMKTRQGWNYFWLEMPEEIRQKLYEGFEEIETEFISRRNRLKTLFRNDSYDLRKRCYIASLFIDMQHLYFEHFATLGKTNNDLDTLSEPERYQLITGVPPLDVEVSLATQHLQQWDRQELVNDVRDISHLSMAVPYCDVVLTERYWVDKLKRERLDLKYDTELANDIRVLSS